MNEGDNEYLCITKLSAGQKLKMEKFPCYSSGLYYTNISTIEAHNTVNQKFTDPDSFNLWHDRLGHPGAIMMRRIIKSTQIGRAHV